MGMEGEGLVIVIGARTSATVSSFCGATASSTNILMYHFNVDFFCYE
jgi:hypothetical protein